MKKLFLISAVLTLIGMQPVQETKEVSESRCVGMAEPYTNIESDPPIYEHCKTCSIGVFFGEKNQEKCSHCGVKKTYKKK